MHRRRYSREICRHMVLESTLADEPQQFLQAGNAHHTRPPKCLQGIVRKLAFPHVARHLSFAVVCRKAREAHRPAFHASHARPKRVLLAHRSRDDFLKIHSYVAEEMFRKIAAVEADRFVWT